MWSCHGLVLPRRCRTDDSLNIALHAVNGPLVTGIAESGRRPARAGVSLRCSPASCSGLPPITGGKRCVGHRPRRLAAFRPASISPRLAVRAVGPPGQDATDGSSPDAGRSKMSCTGDRSCCSSLRSFSKQNTITMALGTRAFRCHRGPEGSAPHRELSWRWGAASDARHVLSHD